MAVALTTPTWVGTKIANCFDLGTKVLKWVRADLDMNGETTYDWVTGFDYVLFAVVQETEVASVGIEGMICQWNAAHGGGAANGTVGITAITGDNEAHLFAVGF